MLIILASLIVAVPPKPVMVTDQFLSALALVEWGGEGPAPSGDGGRAVGPFQIHNIYRREANQIMRAYVFSSDLRTDYEASREMARIVLTHWGKYHRARGVKITPEVLCSIHRRPNHLWRPKRLKLPLERERTRKLKAYMGL